MKRFSAFILICLLLITVFLYGCDKEVQDYNYVINSGETITVGVLTTSSEDNGYISGINYASQLAHTVNLDKPYEINVKSINITAENISDAVLELTSLNVAAVICEGKDKATTDMIINGFDNMNNTPLVFVDNYSNSISETDNVFSISVPSSYQASAVVSHLLGEGKTTGAVVCATDDKHNQDLADAFSSSFTSSGGKSVTTYFYAGESKNYNANTIATQGNDFVFIVGNTAECKTIHSELKSCGITASIIFSEVSDKTYLESKEYNNVDFISKFEPDDNNYIGTDFINTYADNYNISTSDVTASIAYGYDAYMTIYDTLVSLNKNHNSIFQTTTTSATDEDSNTDIKVSEFAAALKNTNHMGVTDVISFTESGLATPTFIYVDRIENSYAGMLNRYNYSNEQN